MHKDAAAEALQWGRDVSIPEIWVYDRTASLQFGLQWGRDVSIPEMAPTQAFLRDMARLQWGRDVSIPEITDPWLWVMKR